jgi:hypothetical protein
MNVNTAIATSGKFSSRLPNAIAVFSEVCPGELAATRLVLVHCGQSGQPSPDELSRSAAPVHIRTAFAMTDASANPRTEPRVGRSTGPVSRAAIVTFTPACRPWPSARRPTARRLC